MFKKEEGHLLPPGPRVGFYRSYLKLQKDPLSLILQLQNEYGGVVRFRVGLWNAYILTSPEAVKHVLVDNHRNYNKKNVFVDNILKRILGRGLFTSEGEFWRRQRRMIQPIFHSERIQAYGELMVDESVKALTRWEPYVREQKPLDMAGEMMRLSLNIAGRALFGLDLSNDTERVGTVAMQLAEGFGRIGVGSLLFFSLPTKNNRKTRAALNDLDNIIYDLIQLRRKELHKRVSVEPLDLLSLLILSEDEDTGKKMGDRQIRDEVTTLLLAGYDTTFNALSWTLYLLSQNPEAAKRLQQELQQVLGGRVPCVEDISALHYTQMIIQEAMRLYPSVWGFSRTSIEQDLIEGYRIPAGSFILLAPFATHRFPGTWENPENFEPERFHPSRKNERPKHAYFPFGSGMRLCIGKHFAMTETVLVLATIAQRVKFQLVPGVKVKPNPLVTLCPSPGLPMFLQPIK